MTQRKNKSFWKQLGPGLITGISDDDPSGIATYSQAGAQFGFGLLWTMVFSLPLMIAIQEISALLGRVTGRGIAAILRRHYNPWITYPVVFTLAVVNTINLGADLGAMGEAFHLVVGGPRLPYALLFGIFCAFGVIYFPYRDYVKYLKWLCVSLIAYLGTAMIVHFSWLEALKNLVVPSMKLNSDAVKMFLAVLGTTLSPYLFFWQASEEVEERKNVTHKKPLKTDLKAAPAEIKRIQVDTIVGMAASNIAAVLIMITTAATLHKTGKTDIQTAADAAEALRPLAGNACFLIFSLGIIGTGLLAVPVLAGSAAYAVGETFNWRIGLQKKFRQAKHFYTFLAVATLLGSLMDFMKIDPVKALVWAAVLNGIIAAPIMAVMIHMGGSERVMGKLLLSNRQKALGWLACAVMAIATVALFVI